MPTPLQTLLANYRAQSQTEREKGNYFEELIRVYLCHEPLYADLYEEVWLYSDWARREGRDARDVGIDLVARTKTGADTPEYHAIQCKFHAPDHKVTKSDIDSFFTASGQAPFTHRIIVSTSDRWTEHADSALIGQTPPVTKIDLLALEESQIDWSRYQPGAPPALKPKKQPRPHQESALADVTAGLAKADRGKLIMACGTGKTFTALKIAETLAGRDKRVLFLVPSLNLLSQTLTEWTQESQLPLHGFAVCSDSEVGKKRPRNANPDDDRVETFAHELRYPATTNAYYLAQAMAKRHDAEHMTVVFSTYHSIGVIHQAQHQHDLAPFDLIICDEAHRTTGATFDEDESNFVKVHDAEFIRAAKRLYMTATPRIYGDAAKISQERGEVMLASMDDADLYGEDLHVLTFSQAVNRGLLVDYKVMVLAMDEAHISRRLQHLLKDENNSLRMDDAAKIVGCWKALNKHQSQEERQALPPDPMRRAVAFCQVIEPQNTGHTGKAKTRNIHKVSSKQIAGMFQAVVRAYQEHDDEPEGYALLDCDARHVDGSMNASQKEAKLDWLKAEPPDNTCRILSNVRCLSEGVDVPALDAVLFLTPRSSQVEVVQAVGRVMRNAPGKKLGYVILPVVIPAGLEPHQALADNRAYKVVWEVLQALRAHDDHFDAMINKLDLTGAPPAKMEVIAINDREVRNARRRRQSRADKLRNQARGGQSIGMLAEPEAPYYPGDQMELEFAPGEVERALYAKIVEKCGRRTYWEEWAGDVARIARTHITRIRTILENPANKKEQSAFRGFVKELRDDLNPAVTEEEVIEMLAQHLITQPVFEALFQGPTFDNQYPVGSEPYPAKIDPDLPKPDLVLPKPGPDLPGPGPDLPRPDLVLPRPGPVLPEPDLVLPRPGPDLPGPDLVLPKPGPDLPRPGPDLPEPDLVLPKPGPDLPEPDLVLPKPGPVLPKPDPVLAKPDPDLPEPDPDLAMVGMCQGKADQYSHDGSGPAADNGFAAHNPVSQGMQQVLDLLHEHHLEKEADTLQEFYASVRMRAEGIDNAEGKQKIILELYDKFFRNAFPRMTERLGIVYTPVEVVDFILHSIEHLLKTQFRQSLGSPGVHIIDPFTGTGTFITRLLQSGLIAPEQLPHKYQNEIHANEIVLLAYYIAAINIETTYHGLGLQPGYQPFPGICLTDTFQMDEGEDLISEILVDNSERRTRQKELKDIRVIMGNPPYSAGQDSANDNNQNIKYPQLDGRIRTTYVARTKATLRNALYDSYIRAIRWASDRIGDAGIIGFVTNAGFLEANTADGLRQCLAEEFSSLYVFHLRGNQRTSGERSRQEGGKIFGSGSRAPIAISLLVKNPEAARKGQIRLHDIGDYLTRAQKLERIAEFKDIHGISAAQGWQEIKPDSHGDWLNQREEGFEAFIVMGDKKDKKAVTLFENYSNGVKTNRDAWCYNASGTAVGDNMQRMISFYNGEVARFNEDHGELSTKERQDKVDGFINTDPTKISWTVNVKQELVRNRSHHFQSDSLTPSLYRPFSKQWLYFNRHFNERVLQMPRLFPHAAAENLVICVSGIGARNFSTLISDHLPCFDNIEKGQCFPRYLYEPAPQSQQTDLFTEPNAPAGYRRRDAITDAGLAHFRNLYPGQTITKEDLFYYCYGLLHSEDYRARYAANLAKQLPRIPAVKSFTDFCAFTRAGRDLAALHLNYEGVDMYPTVGCGEERTASVTEHRDAVRSTHRHPTGQTVGCGEKRTASVTGHRDAVRSTHRHPTHQTVEMRPATLESTATDPAHYRVEKMRHGKTKQDGKTVKDPTTIVYNPHITVKDIPLAAYDYVVNGKSAIDWVMERQSVKTDKASGIVNDANHWATETMNNPKYPLELLLRVITVSIETMKIVRGLPALEIG
uniref:N-6 DNA Methylase n=1 Tax=Candidatus Kentrum sp. DK TaxID=2126562 RepID=A0A450SRK5_9GAMM|nr:MAG: N-6 DNA Methylase [Candidatus Kentron sp. DK]